MYLFDTDVLSMAIRPQPPLQLIRKLASIPPHQQYTSSINVGELVYGVSKRSRPDLAQRVTDLISGAQIILPFDEPAAWVFGKLKAKLERDGTTLAEPDLRIAAIALAKGLTLVTGNTRHFERVPQLQVENWLVT